MKKMLLITAAMMVFLPSCCCLVKEKPVKKDIGIQLYSIRHKIGSPELYAQNHIEVFKGLADLGYTAVEAASYADGKLYGVAPEQFKSDVEAAGLIALSSHVVKELSQEEMASGDFSASLQWWKQCVEAHEKAGMKYIVMPWLSFPATLKDLQLNCEYFNAVGKLCKERGILFGYHNHAHEFNKVEDKELMYDYLLSNTDPELVFFQMDVYWTVKANYPPVDYFKKYPGRFKLLHIKDVMELGQSGMVGFDAIFNNAETAGLEYPIVELEGCSADDWKESVGACSKYLIEAPFVKSSYAGAR